MKSLFRFSLILLLIFSVHKVGLSLPLNSFISSVSPPMNAVSVNKSSNIVIAFTQKMNPATVNNSNIKVFGFQTGLLTTFVIYDEITKTATIDPENNFKVGEFISVSLTAGLETITSEKIIPFVFTFIVKATDGTGRFVKTSGIDSLTTADLKSGDIDGDGNIDLIVNNKIYKNDGRANFAYHQTLSISGAPELTDFDNDGDLDILIGSNNNINIYKNDGGGNFSLTMTLSGSFTQIGDLNGDGYLDISYFVSTFGIATIFNVNGTFIRDTTIHFNASCQYGENRVDNILICDLDNDGDLDMIAISYTATNTGPLFYNICRYFNKLTNNSHGDFIIQSIHTDQAQSFTYQSLFYFGSRAFDFDDDKDIDIVSPGKILINRGDETFSSINSFIFSNSQAADFTGDGNIDVVANSYVSILGTRMNDGEGNFIYTYTTPGFFYKGSASGDFDNDGDVDIAVVDYLAHDVSILLNHFARELDLTMFLQGFYRPLSHTSISDTIRVYLRSVNSPYAVIDSAKGLISTSGSAVFLFSNAINDVSYYIQVKHRNSLETWSSAGVSFINNSLAYDFSSALANAYGDNMIQIDNSPLRFGFYSGDINQDQIIDAADLSAVDNALFNGASGYIAADLTGDRFVDASDLSIVHNNAANGVRVRNPITGDSE